VLNIGAGGELGKCVGESIAIDIDSQRGPDIIADVCDLHAVFEANTFDAVFLLEVLEHVQEPQSALSEIYRILKPGGKIVMSTPYIFEMHDVPYDFWRFTEYGLKQLLHRFEDVRIQKRNGYFKALYTPLIRLLYSPYVTDRFVGLFFSIFALPFYPVMFAFDCIIRSDYLTTGYHVTAKKPGP
jgi:SAM-dependent methyltransferase